MAVLSENRKANFTYHILEKFQAGLSLLGPEVKSARLGRMQIAGSYAHFKGNELFLVGSTIPPYQPNNMPEGYDPSRARKLLLSKKELLYLAGKAQERGLTLVPLRVYSSSAGKIKLELGLAKGKKIWDKREALKKRDIEQEIRQNIRG